MFDFDELEEQIEEAEAEARALQGNDRKGSQDAEYPADATESAVGELKEATGDRLQNLTSQSRSSGGSVGRAQNSAPVAAAVVGAFLSASAETADEHPAVDVDVAVANVPASLTQSEAGSILPGSVVARVVFHLKDQTWAHEFTIERGCTVHGLKRRMTRSSPDEASWFVLRHLGRAVPDHEIIVTDSSFDFEFRGPPKDVDVVVRHAMDTGSQLCIKVPETATIFIVREAAAEALREQAGTVKIVSQIRGSNGFRVAPDGESIGERREFVSTCEALLRSEALLRRPVLAT